MREFSVSVHKIRRPSTHITIAVWVLESTMTRGLSKTELPFIRASVWPFHRANPMPHASKPLSLICCATLVGVRWSRLHSYTFQSALSFSRFFTFLLSEILRKRQLCLQPLEFDHCQCALYESLSCDDLGFVHSVELIAVIDLVKKLLSLQRVNRLVWAKLQP